MFILSNIFLIPNGLLTVQVLNKHGVYCNHINATLIFHFYALLAII